MEKIIAEFTLSEMDYRRTMYFFAFRRNKFISLMFAVAFFAGLIVLSYFFLSTEEIGIFVLLVGIVLAVSPLLGCLLTEFKLAHFLSSDKTATGEATKVTFNENGIISENASHSMNRAWDTIYRINETRRYFIIHLNSKQNIVLPKKCLENELEILTLKKLFIMYVARGRIRFVDM